MAVKRHPSSRQLWLSLRSIRQLTRSSWSMLSPLPVSFCSKWDFLRKSKEKRDYLIKEAVKTNAICSKLFIFDKLFVCTAENRTCNLQLDVCNIIWVLGMLHILYITINITYWYSSISILNISFLYQKYINNILLQCNIHSFFYISIRTVVNKIIAT